MLHAGKTYWQTFTDQSIVINPKYRNVNCQGAHWEVGGRALQEHKLDGLSLEDASNKLRHYGYQHIRVLREDAQTSLIYAWRESRGEN